MVIKDRLIHAMMSVFGSDERRIKHALKVLKYAEEILQNEIIDLKMHETIIAAAILHDIGIQEAERKYNSNSGKYQEIEGPPIARNILICAGVDTEIIERVCYIIGGHHTWSKNDGIDFQIIWEADLLVNIEEDGLNNKGVNLRDIVDKNFKTAYGRGIAEKLYLK